MDEYYHKLTGEKLRIKKILGSVAICYIEEIRYIYGNIKIDTCVCDMNNLTKAQLKLF